jgi:hypothetical protein
MFGIRKKIARTAKRAGLLTGGLLLCCVGTGFLTVSAWLGLVSLVGAQLTATIIAGAYLGVGFILIGIASRKTVETETIPQPNQPDTPPIVQAFMYGLQAGSKGPGKH